MDENKTEVEVKVTWKLAWGLFWRQLLIGLAFTTVIYAFIFALFGAALLAMMQ
jgi:hypothetical protein